mmetsp:Transcript_73096/g.202742  ORF Transcript_73096/g.202742 Transcript_73096/m.202742 type:complete len:123 (-) Transcript_73096:394-762(-)
MDFWREPGGALILVDADAGAGVLVPVLLVSLLDVAADDFALDPAHGPLDAGAGKFSRPLDTDDADAFAMDFWRELGGALIPVDAPVSLLDVAADDFALDPRGRECVVGPIPSVLHAGSMVGP